MTKSIVFNLLLFVLFFCTMVSKAQTIELQTPLLNLKVGGVPQSVTIKYTNTTGALAAATTVRVAIPAQYKGVYLYSPIAIQADDRSTLDFNIRALNAGEFISLTMTIQAGYCYEFGEGLSNVNLTDVLSVTQNGTALSFTNDNLKLSIDKSNTLSKAFEQNTVSRNGQPIPISNANMTINATNNDIVVREYVYLNPSSTDTYTGTAELNGPDNLIDPLRVDNLEAYVNDVKVSGGTIDKALWTLSIPFSVPPNGKLVFRETVIVTGCLLQAETVINFAYGVGPWDNCSNTTNTITPNLQPITEMSFVIDEEHSNYKADDRCIADGINGSPKNIIYNYTGEAEASTTLSLLKYVRATDAVEKSSVKFYLTKVGGVRTEYQIDWSANDVLSGPAYPYDRKLTWDELPDELKNDPNYRSYFELYYMYGVNHSGAFSVYDLKLNLAANGYDRQDPYRQFPLLVNMFITYDDFLKNAYAGQDVSTHPFLVDNLPNGINTELVFGAQVSKYFENGVSKSLVLAKGDKVELEWIDYTTCRNQYAYSSIHGMWTHVHSEDACKNPFNTMHGNYHFDGSANFFPDPGNTNISGEVDLCTQTQDGQIENVSFKLIPNLGLQPEVADLSGKIVFRVYLEDGLDMDRSFEKPASLNLTKRGYQLDGTCSKACDGCDPNDVLTNESYNTVKYVLNNGNELSVSNGLLSVKRVAWKDNATNPIPLDFIKSPSSYTRKPASAYYVYEIEMDIATIGIPVVAGKTDYNLDIRDYLYNGRLSFDVRCYCPSNPTGKAGIQVLAMYDKCTSATPPQSCNVPFFTRLWPLNSTEYSYQINCPGCRIPGSNIGVNSFMRQNTGFLDANQDGFADGVNGDLPIPSDDLIRRSGTEGDIMKAKFSVSMSEGVAKSTGLGFTKYDFEADANLMLDNLIIKVTTQDSRTTYSPGTAKVSYQGSTYNILDADNYWLSGNTAFFRIPAALIHSKILLSDLSQIDGFHVDDPLIFEANFVLTAIPGVTQTSEVLYQAGYTTCETCTTDFFAVEPSFEVATSADQYAAVLANKEKVFLICTDGGTNFKSVPFHVERNVTAYNRLITSDPYANIDAISSCEKSILIYNWGEMGAVNNQGGLNMFENECRYFIDPTIPIRSELTLPKGYTIDRVEVLNQTNQANYRIVERYVIPGSQLTNYSDATQNSFWLGTTSAGNDLFGVNLFYKRELENEKSSYFPDGVYYRRNMSGTTLPAQFFVKDENWLTQVFIILKPSLIENSNCMPLGETLVFPEDHYVTNIPISPDPNVFSNNASNPSNNLIASYNTPNGQTRTGTDGIERNYFDGVNAQLQLNYLSDANLRVNGNQLDIKINIKELSNSYQADYPFLVLEGAALDPLKGLEFDGIYWNDGTGVKTINYPVYIDHSGGKHRILLGINDPRFSTDGTGLYPTLLKSSNSNYVLRFKYTCSTITDQGCGGNPIIDNGLNNNELKITPGYACVLTPDFAAYDAGKYCAKFEPKIYSLSSQVYGSDKKPSFVIEGNVIQSPSTVNLSNCETFKYNLELKSCQEGAVKGFDILFSNLPQGTGLPVGASLPLGLTINGATVLSNTDFTIVQDANNPLLYNVSTTDPTKYLTLSSGAIQISFDMSISCAFETSMLYAKVSGIAICGGNLSPAYLSHQLVAAPPAFDQVVSGLQCSTSGIVLNYAASTATTHSNTIVLTLPAGLQFADDATTLRTISIPVGTSGATSITYPINVIAVGNGTIKASLNQNLTVQCTSEQPCEKTKTTVTECSLDYTCSITAQAGPDQAGCSGISYTLSTGNVQPGFTYTWTGGGQSYLGATVQVSPAITTTYILSVRSSTNVNCTATTDDVTITILNPSVTLIGADHVCPESSGTLTAQLSGSASNINYTWYSLVNGNHVLIQGPSSLNTYTHYGLAVTTTFEVVVSSPNSSCNASASKTVSLYNLPQIGIQAPDEFCIGSAPAKLIGLPAGGYFDGPGVTLTSGVYTFSSTVAGTYDVYYYSPDLVTGCTAYAKHTIVVNACCKYALASTEVMCGEDAIRCITLNAVKPVDDGIKGMDFILRYDRTLMTPTGLPGRGNATLGNVVLNGGMTSGMGNYAMTQRTIAGTNFNELSVSIFYTGQAPAAADFDGIGDVICIEFKILGTGTANLAGQTRSIFIGDFYQGVFTQGSVDDEHKVSMIRSCVENNGVGVISILKNNLLNGKVYYHNDVNAPLKYDALTTPSPYLITTVTPVTTGYGSPLCTPSPVAAKTTDINGAYSIDLTGANGIKLSRDIVGDYYNSCTNPSDVIDQTGNVYAVNPATLLMAINGYDTYLMESITTMRNPADVVYVADRKVPGITVANTATSYFPTPFQMIASDVNMDRMVRAVDISLVQERAVSKLCEYPQVWNYNLGVDPSVYPLNSADQRSLDWRFVDKSQVGTNLTYKKSARYPLPPGGTGTGAAGYWRDNVPNPPLCLMGPAANPNTCKSYAASFDIHAIMLGDVDGSWRANFNNAQKNLRTVSDRQVVINVTNKQRKGINTYRVPVTFISQDPATVSLDFALDYNEDELSIAGVGNLAGGDLAEADLVYNDFENKQLLLTSYTMVGFNSSQSIYYIDFVSKNGDFNANMLGTGDAYLNGEKVELVVEGSTITGIENQLIGSQYGFELVPNPAAHEGEILYNIKTGSHAKIVVYNTLGQVITEYKDLEGQGSIQVGTSDWSSGMYQVILFTENSQKLIKKWVIQN